MAEALESAPTGSGNSSSEEESSGTSRTSSSEFPPPKKTKKVKYITEPEEPVDYEPPGDSGQDPDWGDSDSSGHKKKKGKSCRKK